MAISWLTSLKVVPWDKILENVPGVLDKARGFIDKHSTGGVDAPTELVQMAKQQMAQALAELAEKNAALVVAVRRLQVRLREHWAGDSLLCLWGCAFREVVQFFNKNPALRPG